MKSQIYTIEITTNTDGDKVMKRTNDGFAAHELLGLMEFTKQEVLQQMAGEIIPDVVEREVIVD